jgi:hypothetical protein
MPETAADIAGRDFLGPARAGGAMVLRRVNTPWPAIIIFIIIATALAPAGFAAASPDRPDTAQAVEAFSVVRGWVNDFTLPPPDAPAARIEIDSLGGACVLLRHNGRLIGTGTDRGSDGLTIRRAAGRALGEALADPVLADLPDSVRAATGTNIVLELELAGPMQPLLGRWAEEWSVDLEPGLDGLALRRGDAWAARFPAMMLATGAAERLTGAWAGLAAELGLSARHLVDLPGDARVGAYRFRTVHLAQSQAQARPIITFRGDVVVDDRTVTRDSIAALADGVARHIMSRRWPAPLAAEEGGQPPPRAPLGLMGDYRPSADQYHPQLAGPPDQALAAMALARYGLTPGVDAATAALARSMAADLLDELAIVQQGEADPRADIDACAAIVLAAGEASWPSLPPRARTLAAEARQALAAAAAATAAAGEKQPDHAAGPHNLALRAAAMARLLRDASDGSPPPDPGLVRACLDAAWSSAPPQEHVALLPWIGWAEEDFAAATNLPPSRLEALRDLRRHLHAAQIVPGSRDGPPDLRGGFALRVASAGHSPATAQSLRPLAWLAGILPQRQLVPADEQYHDIARLLRAMRFVMQISVRAAPDGADGWVRNSERTIGGIRNAPWDSQMPLAAQSMGLLSACQMLRTLEAVSPPDAPQPPPPAAAP